VNVASIIYDDRPLLEIRIRRLRHPRAHVMSPRPHITHLVTNVDVLSEDVSTGTLQVEGAFLVVEHRKGRQRIFSGRYRYDLRRVSGSLKIASKRVDLADCEGAHDAIALFL
jgi:3-phenylpropionate/cinnamic acid dioxygenase small subunit